MPDQFTHPEDCTDHTTGSEKPVVLQDDFVHDLGPGAVIGSLTPDGHQRRGADPEGVLSVHNGVLRIRPLAEPGWGRASLAYGPFQRRAGLAMAAYVLNADNGAAPYKLGSFYRRVGRWLLGSGETPLLKRLTLLPRRWRCEPLPRRLLRWHRALKTRVTAEQLGGNLAVGWFGADVPSNPVEEGEAWVVRGAGPDNAHLLCHSGNRLMPVDTRFPNMPMHYIVLLRTQGAAYYLPSTQTVAGELSFPTMRPVAIDPTGQTQELWAGVHQSAVGEIGFSGDTQVHGLRVADLPDLALWYGTAQAADLLTGQGDLAGSLAEKGGLWTGSSGAFRRTPQGCVPSGAGLVLLAPFVASGLIHAVIEAADQPGAVTLVWRAVDADHCWQLRLEEGHCTVEERRAGTVRLLHPVQDRGLRPGCVSHLQVTDEGTRIQIMLDGEELCTFSSEDRLESAWPIDGRRVGLAADGPGQSLIRQFEAHPRAVPIPPVLCMAAPWVEDGTCTLVEEDFSGPPHDDLDGYISRGLGGRTAGKLVWRKLMGVDRMALDGHGVQVIASPAKPVRRRLAYGIDWACPGFADLSAILLPPPAVREEDCRGRAGLIFWQDPDNYLMVNSWLDNSHSGGFKHCGAVSSFFHLNGFEDIYDAAWTNVGDSIQPGIPVTLRVVSDGDRYRVHVDGRAVLYRRLSDIYPGFPGLTIRRVGILANWEWGHDTGSRFLSFTASARDMPGSGWT